MSMCRVLFYVVGRRCLQWLVHSLGKTLLAFALLHFVLPRPNLPVTPCISWLPTFAFQFPIMKRTSFWGVSSISVHLKKETSKLVNFCVQFSSVQFSLVAQSCPTLCDPMDCSTPGFHVLHHLPVLAQTHVHWVSDAIQPSHPLSFPSPPASKPSPHQDLFQWVNSSHQVPKRIFV